MIYNNVELHNFEEVKRIEGRQGVLLQRIPTRILNQLRKQAQEQFIKPGGGEIRFVSEANEESEVTLISYGEKSIASVYVGDFQFQEYEIGNKPTTIKFPTDLRVNELTDKYKDYLFSPKVKRIILDGEGVHLISIKGKDIRPPKDNEVPNLRYLAYGTSITHGYLSTSPMLSYAKQTSLRLNVDVINLGVSGAAFCEKELADYIAVRNDWDFMTLCLSVNMLNQGVSLEEFIEKANYMVTTIAEKNPGKPIVCISVLPFFIDKGIYNPMQNPLATPMEYRNALENIVENSKLHNLYYIDGRKLLKHFGYLSSDLLHPGNLGMIEIGENLAKFIEPLLEKYNM